MAFTILEGIPASSLCPVIPVLGWGSICQRTSRPRTLKCGELATPVFHVRTHVRLGRYIYQLFLGVDGNYSLQKKTKPGDDTDYSLVGDNGFFNNVNKLQDFLKKYPKEHWVIVSAFTSSLLC